MHGNIFNSVFNSVISFESEQNVFITSGETGLVQFSLLTRDVLIQPFYYVITIMN